MAWFFSHQVDNRTNCCLDSAERSTTNITDPTPDAAGENLEMRGATRADADFKGVSFPTDTGKPLNFSTRDSDCVNSDCVLNRTILIHTQQVSYQS